MNSTDTRSGFTWEDIMPYKVDDATLERINRRVAERLRAHPVMSKSRAAGPPIIGNDDAAPTALPADIAALLANFSTDDLANALKAATKKVLGEETRHGDRWCRNASPTEQISAREK